MVWGKYELCKHVSNENVLQSSGKHLLQLYILDLKKNCNGWTWEPLKPPVCWNSHFLVHCPKLTISLHYFHMKSLYPWYFLVNFCQIGVYHGVRIWIFHWDFPKKKKAPARKNRGSGLQMGAVPELWGFFVAFQGLLYLGQEYR